jgi:hypothetical protein
MHCKGTYIRHMEDENLYVSKLESQLDELRAEVDRLRFKNEQLVTAGKSLVRALRFSSEWSDAVADLEDLVGETK